MGPGFTRQVANTVGPLIKRYHRAEVRNIDNIPPTGGALVVSNHSGGMLTPDVFIFSPAFYQEFGYDRPVYTLGHYGIFIGPVGRRAASPRGHRGQPRECRRRTAFGRGGAGVPGRGLRLLPADVQRTPSTSTAGPGYVSTAIEAGVPIVPMVSIGGQETQLFLTRGNWLAKKLGMTKARMDILPMSFGFPFGLSMIFPPNLPLPSKIVTEVLEPIHITEQFGTDPDVDEVDEHVRSVMQTALDRLAKQRRFPILG